MFKISRLLSILVLLSVFLVSQASFLPLENAEISTGSIVSYYKRHGPPGTHNDDKPQTSVADGHDHDHAAGEVHKEDAQTLAAEECTAIGVDNFSRRGQIGSLFIILAVGAVGVFLPIIGYRFKAFKPPQLLMDIGKFLGIGVILSVAIIHIYASAVAFLSDECVSGPLGNYEGWAGVIFVMAIFLMQLIDFMVLKKFGRPSHSSSSGADLKTGEQQHSDEQAHIHTNALSHAHAHSHGHAHSHVNVFSDSEDSHNMSTISSISVALLELSIIFHSFIIGMTLGLTGASSLLTLTIAIAFHQLFEGIAIGDRLGCAYADSIKNNQEKSGKKMMMMFSGAFLYSLSTPVGQAIGIAIHSTLNTRSPTFLIVLGSLEAVSAGILIYVVLIHLISEEFSTKRFWDASGTTKAICFLSMYFGAAAMAVIGKWA